MITRALGLLYAHHTYARKPYDMPMPVCCVCECECECDWMREHGTIPMHEKDSETQLRTIAEQQKYIEKKIATNAKRTKMQGKN